MQFFIAVTDNSWFDFLSKLQPDEVNFWRPSGQSFKSIEPGAPFLFKLHSPLNYIVGGGYFVRSEALPLSLAWNAFREKTELWISSVYGNSLVNTGIKWKWIRGLDVQF